MLFAQNKKKTFFNSDFTLPPRGVNNFFNGGNETKTYHFLQEALFVFANSMHRAHGRLPVMGLEQEESTTVALLLVFIWSPRSER